MSNIAAVTVGETNRETNALPRAVKATQVNGCVDRFNPSVIKHTDAPAQLFDLGEVVRSQ